MRHGPCRARLLAGALLAAGGLLLLLFWAWLRLGPPFEEPAYPGGSSRGVPLWVDLLAPLPPFLYRTVLPGLGAVLLVGGILLVRGAWRRPGGPPRDAAAPS